MVVLNRPYLMNIHLSIFYFPFPNRSTGAGRIDNRTANDVSGGGSIATLLPLGKLLYKLVCLNNR